MADDHRDDRFVRQLFRLWSWSYDGSLLQPLLYRPVHRRVARLLAGTPAATGRIVDVGCGTGRLVEELRRTFPGAAVLGLDASIPMLAAGRRRPGTAGLTFVCADAAALPIASYSVDAIVCTLAYHWFVDPRPALAEFHRVLRSDGRLVIGTLVTFLLPLRFLHQRFVPVDTHRADLAAAGFRFESAEWLGTHVRVLLARRA